MSISVDEILKKNWKYRLTQNMRIRQAMFRKRYEPVTYKPWHKTLDGNPRQCPDRIDPKQCDCENELENY